MTVGDAVRHRIKELCDMHGITLNKLATESGITQSTLNNIISGRNNSCSVATVKKICDGLDIPLECFFAGDIFKHLEQEIK